jgi:DNA-binding response OmpR family regulator
MSLQANGYKIAEASDGKSGILKVSEFHPHLVILDPDQNIGFEYFNQIL